MAKKQTYAAQAKAIMKKYEPRLGEKFDKGDVLALEAMNQELEGLKEKQEKEKLMQQIDGASPEQISQLSQAMQQQQAPQQGQQGPQSQFQAQQFQGPDQPGIPQGGPSGLAGGQQGAPPQIAGQSRFADGGGLPTYQGLEPYSSQLPQDNNQAESQRLVNIVRGMVQNNPYLQQQLRMKGIDVNDPQALLSVTSELMRDYPQEFQQAAASTAQADRMLGIVPEILSRQPTAESQAILNPKQPVDAFTGATVNVGDPNRPGSQANSMTELERIAAGGYQYDPNAVGSPQSVIAPGGGQPGTAGGINPQTIGRGTGIDVQTLDVTGGGGIGGGFDDPFASSSEIPYRDDGPRAPGDPTINFTPGVTGSVEQGLPSLDLANQSTAASGGLELGEALGKTPGQLDVAGDVGGGEAFSSRVPWIGAAAQAAESLLSNREIDFSGIPKIKPVKVSPRLVDYAREREQTQRERDIANAQVRYSAKGRGSQAALTETIGAGTTASQRVAGQQFGQSLQREGNTNAQIQNAAAQFNAQQRTRANMINAQMEREQMMINQQRKDAQIGGVGQAVQGYGQDLMSANQYDQMVNMLAAENPNYNITGGKDSLLRKIFQVSKDQQINFLNTNDKV